VEGRVTVYREGWSSRVQEDVDVRYDSGGYGACNGGDVQADNPGMEGGTSLMSSTTGSNPSRCRVEWWRSSTNDARTSAFRS
jgi:hypothetical protein